jgi:hypothetical protein
MLTNVGECLNHRIGVSKSRHLLIIITMSTLNICNAF